MASSSSLLSLPFLTILIFFSSTSSTSYADTAADFNILTLKWPGVLCNNLIPICCTPTTGPPAFDFLVEKLVAYSSTTGGPVDTCTSACKFYVNALRNFITDMYSYWPSLGCPSNNNKDYWETTWCRYGSGDCGANLTETDYFQRSLNMRSRIDLLYVLTEMGIVPDEHTRYALADIEAALLPSLGFSFFFECTRNFRPIPDLLLHKIHICVSRDAKRIISCPIPRNNIQCNNYVRFLPFDSSMVRPSRLHNPINMPHHLLLPS